MKVMTKSEQLVSNGGMVFILTCDKCKTKHVTSILRDAEAYYKMHLLKTGHACKVKSGRGIC